MGKFVKKPVEIEAVQFNGVELVDDVYEPMFDLGFSPPDWIVDAQAKPPSEPGALWCVPGYAPPVLQIFTLEGLHTAMPGDWIIRGVKGELYPCKPDIFSMTYDPVEG